MTWRSPAGPGPADHPLSDGQRALWFLQRLQPTAAAWNIAAAARVRGGLDPSRFHLALEGLARRHEALRLGFHERPGGPVQRLRAGEAVDFREEDAAGWDETRLRAYLHGEAERPFDLARDPLMRVRLLRTGKDDILLLVIHHLISDLGSIAVLVRELGPLYEGDGELPPPPVPYTVLVEQQGERLAGKTGERHWAYWRERLAGPLPTCELPADRPRPARRSFRGGSRTRRIDPTVEGRLRRVAREHRAGLFAALLAGFEALLQRGTGQSDLLVGSPTSGRLAPELEGAVGYFVNPVVLRSDLSGSPSFRQLLDRIRSTVLGALRHQEYPFARLVERLQPDRDPARPPIFQVMLAFQRAHLPHLETAGDLGAFALGVAGARVRTGSLELESLPLERCSAQVDLELMAAESSGGIELALTFDADLFDPTTAERLLAHLETLLAGAAAGPDRCVGELPLLSLTQSRQLLRSNQSCRPLPGRRVHELFREQAARTPEATAVTAPDGLLTYRELRERADRVARALLAAGLRPEEPVAVRAERGASLVVALLGILEAGGVYLPLSPDQPEARRARILERSGARIVLERGRPLPQSGGGTERRFPVDLPEEALAYLLFTSGSTGEPKGVQVPHRGLLNHLLAKIHHLGLTAADRVAQTASPGFDISIWQLLAPLLAGATVEVVPDAVVRDSSRLLAEIADRGITVLELVPSALAPLADEIERSGWSGGLRWLISTGEVLPPELARRWLALGTEAGLVNGYGPTECADRVSHAFLRSVPAEATRVAIGRPIPNLRLHVLSIDLQEQPEGFPGEVCIAGTGVGRGYLHDPARTAAAFLPDPFGSEPGGRLYRTGDLGRRRTDGEIEILGRLDHQVKLRGVRIEPGEVEAALLGHPGVREAVVAARGGRLVAWWTGDPGAAPELRGHLRERLPDAMVPAVLQHLEALPLTPHGKVDRRALPDPEPGAGRDALPDELEPLLTGIFSAVLGRERVGAHDRFFELGGHSLLAAQVAARVRDALGIEPPIGLLFEEPSAAGLARRLRDLQREAAGLPQAPPLRPMPREARIPLSFAQQRLWFLHRLDPESPAYNMPGLVRIPRPVSPPALAASLTAVAARHETLRTTFPEADGEPYQEIAPDVEIPVPLVDLAGLPGPAAEAERLAFEEARRPFDLVHGPLLRPLLLRLGPADHHLVVSLHHIAGDGWSQEILLREASALYRGSATLPALPVQYADYALWQRRWMEGETFLTQLAWWKGELAGDLPPLALPLDRPRPPRPRHRGARLPVRIDPGTARELRRIARQAGATPFMAVLAAFQALLHRLSGQEDVRVGSPVANRRQVEVEGLIGVFANTLVLRTCFGTGEGLRDLLERVRRTALGAYTHQDLPYERLVDELGEPGRTPLFQALLAFRAPAETAFPVEEIDNGTAKFDLSLALRETEDRFDGWIEHDTDLLDSATVSRWTASFLTLLEAAAADPRQPVAELPVLGPEERGQLLAEWNDTRAPIPDLCAHHLFEAQAARTPDAVAVRFRDEALTYAELDAQAGHLARRLARLGAGPETAVGLLAQRSLEMVVGLLGILKAGASWVPLDPAYPQERLDWMIEDSGARLVLTRERIREELATAQASPLSRSGGWAMREGGQGGEVPENLAYTIFTSGSTGRPKGVQVPHRALVNFLASAVERPGLRPDDVLLAVTTLSFDIAILDLLLPLTVGARVVVVEREAAMNGARLAAEIERSGATVLQATPATWRLLLESGWGGSPDLTALSTGEALPRELARALLDRTAALWNLYGPTETTVWSSVHPVLETERTVPIGRPIANTVIHLVDRSLQPVPTGVPGELLLGGAGLARGYAGRPDLTAERFVPDPFGGPGERLYRTGDLARRLPDGRLEVLGRLDQQVKLRGFRIELEEVEAALEAHPAVARAVAAIREVARDPRLVSWVVPAGELDLHELRESIARRLPELMIPSLFTIVDNLPLTPNGKVDRRALPDPAPVPEAGDAPQGPMEEAVAEIWAGVLGLERVGRHRSFFELGGHSLLATRAMARINETFLTQLPLRALFEAPTVAGLARLVANLRRARRHRRPPAPPFRRVHRGEPLPPSFAQERLWFMDRLTPGNPVYNVSQALDLDGPLDEPALKRAFAEVARRHEALRTRFATVQGRPMQVVEPVRPRAGGLSVVDLERLPPRLRAAEAGRLAVAEARRPFDLGRGPLLRITLLRLGEGSRRLLVTMHHVVCDDWSVGLLAREVGAIYRGQTLPDLLFQYADYADWQRRWLGSEALEVEIEFWRGRLGGEMPVLHLPSDRPRPALQTFRGAALPLAVPASLTAALRELSLRQGVTLFMTLLAAFATVLHRAAGQDDLIVGTPVAGRVRRETEGLIGFFVNVLPLRLDLSGQPGWAGLLARVRATALEAYDHQDLPFEKLVEALHPKRDLGRAAVRQVGFAYQDANPAGRLLADLLGGAGRLLAREVPVDPGVSRLDLTLFLRPLEDALAGVLEHSTDLFDPATAHRLAGAFLHALEDLAAGVERPLPALSSVAARELRSRAPETNLTEGQLLFWFAHKLHPDTQLYFDRATATFTLEGGLDPAAFGHAFERLLASCDVLRSRVREVGGVPWRSVAEPAPFALEVIDLPEEDFPCWLAERCARPMDLADRLFDTALVRLGPSRHVWFLSLHHLVADAWTLELLARRLSELYKTGHAPPFPSYEEYVAFERGRRTRAAYWDEKLSQPVPAPLLYSRAGSPANTRTARLSVNLDTETSAQIRAAASRLGLFSPSVVFATTFFALLHRLSGEDRLRVGAPFANRPARFRGTPGLMMSALPLDVTVAAGETFASLADQVQQETVDVARHPAHPARAWEIYFNYQSVVFQELCGLPVQFELQSSERSLDRLALQVSDFDGTGCFRLDLDFQQDGFDADQRERTREHFLTLLRAFLADPGLALRDAPLLSPAERARLARFNDTAAPYPRGIRGLGLHHLIEAQIDRTPDAVAVVFEGREMTCRELGERADRLAARLRSQNAVLVGVRLQRSLELMVALLGILKAGAAYVPLDPGYPADRLAWMTEDSGVSLLLDRDMELDAPAADPGPRPFDEAELAYVIYTSGSTGRPKGVMIPHAGICNRLLWMQEAYGLTPADRVLQKTPISFDVSVWELFWPLLAGARLVLARPGGHQDPAYLVSTIVREGITTAHFVPSMLQAFLEQPGVDRCTGLARVICSGEALPEPLRHRFHERLPGVELHNLYGPTEASVDVTAWRSTPDERLPSVPIGRPIANTRVHLLDAHGNLVPPGLPGELCLSGVALARGYLGRPDLTAERFVPDPVPVHPGDRIYRTGDLARWLPDGNLELLGRIDGQVKLRGVRIEPGEIEAALVQVPGVREAVVQVREDRPGDRRLIAWYVPQPGRELSPGQLREALRAKLPEVMVPSVCVPLDTLPLTPSGKVDRRSLPVPETGAMPEQPARTLVESLVAGICAEVLGVEDVPVDASFFDLGGNSLMATQVVNLLQEILPVEIDLRKVFEAPTVAHLAEVVEEERGTLSEVEQHAMTEILAQFERDLDGLRQEG